MATAQLSPLLRYIRKLAAGNGLAQRPDRQLLDDFSSNRDEAAFAALVARHGPMVLRVCRRVLNHEQDAEDAFQATFIVLARSTSSIRKREALAGWLHGVAYRTAMEAKRKAGRRRNHEARLWTSMAKAAVSPSWDDVLAVLDEEIQRLPEVFRSAFVLCVLEGKSGPQAAAELGVKEGTVSSRLTRARQRLQRRLTRRGIRLAALLAALSVAESTQAAVTATLAEVTIRSGLLVAAGGSAAGVIPSHIAALAAGVTRAMFLTKAKIATAMLLAAGFFAAGAGVATHHALAAKETPAAAPQFQQPRPKKETRDRSEHAKPGAEDKDSIRYSGRVLDPDGKPVVGAKLYLKGDYKKGEEYSRKELSPVATTGADGRFKFAVPKAKYADEPTVVTAMATSYGAGWVEVPAHSKRDDLTLQLAKDDEPVTGQIVDLEGKPIAGATLRLVQIKAAAREDVGPWLEAVKAKRGLNPNLPYPYQLLELKYLTRFTEAVSAKATTDADGRFRLTGIGRNRLARLQLDGPTIVSQYLRVLTRPGATIEAIWGGDAESGMPRSVWSYYGANFRYAVEPSKPIVGVVRDKDSKEPVAGVTIQSLNGFGWGTNVQTTSDAQGRFRLTGMPKSEENRIVAIPPRDLPYVAISTGVPDTNGLEPVTADVELKRGIWIEGKITDKVTGKAVRAHVEYFSQSTNPSLRDYPGFYAANAEQDFGEGNEDGSYRVVGLPGPGFVAVRYNAAYHAGYLRAPELNDEYAKASPEGDGFLDTLPLSLIPMGYCAVASIDPAKAVRSVKRDMTLDPGWTFTGTVLGPDGKPLAGARGFGLSDRNSRGRWDREPRKTAEFTVRAFNPRRPRDIFFLHLERGLVGEVEPPKENGGAVAVRMEPGAAVAGRVVDADGRPRAGVELELSFRTKEEIRSGFPQRVITDGEGRFRVGALLSKYGYWLSDGKGQLPVGEGLRSGQTKNLGDVNVKSAGE